MLLVAWCAEQLPACRAASWSALRCDDGAGRCLRARLPGADVPRTRDGAEAIVASAWDARARAVTVDGWRAACPASSWSRWRAGERRYVTVKMPARGPSGGTGGGRGGCAASVGDASPRRSGRDLDEARCQPLPARSSCCSGPPAEPLDGRDQPRLRLRTGRGARLQSVHGRGAPLGAALARVWPRARASVRQSEQRRARPAEETAPEIAESAAAMNDGDGTSSRADLSTCLARKGSRDARDRQGWSSRWLRPGSARANLGGGAAAAAGTPLGDVLGGGGDAR